MWRNSPEQVFTLEAGPVAAFFTTRRDEEFMDRLATKRRVIMLNQIHSNRVVNLDTEKAETGDGLITSQRDVFIGVKVADCLPIYFFTKEQVGIVHAGWRGTASRISTKMLEMFREPPTYVFGPCISPCCFSVGADLYEELHNSFPEPVFTSRAEKTYMDLRAANRYLLSEARELASLDLCTCCNPDSFHSYRRDGKRAGRNYALIGMVGIGEVL